MLIVWRGWGFMALVIPLLCSIPFSSSANPKMVAIGWIIGAIILALWGLHLHAPQNNHVILYDDLGRGYEFKKHIDTLFWIPMEYWGAIWAIIAVCYMLG